jgi:hypothetical protein
MHNLYEIMRKKLFTKTLSKFCNVTYCFNATREKHTTLCIYSCKMHIFGENAKKKTLVGLSKTSHILSILYEIYTFFVWILTWNYAHNLWMENENAKISHNNLVLLLCCWCRILYCFLCCFCWVCLPLLLFLLY